MDTCINTLSSTVQPQDRQINWIQVTLDLIRTVNPPLEFVCGVVDIISKYFKSTENANIQHTNCQKTNATILNLAGPSSSCHLILMCVNYDLNGSLRLNSRLHARLNNQISHPIPRGYHSAILSTTVCYRVPQGTMVLQCTTLYHVVPQCAIVYHGVL